MSVYTEWLDKLDELFELIQSKSLKTCFMNHLSVFNNNLEVKTAKELIDVFAKSYTDTFKHFHSIHDQELNGALSIVKTELYQATFNTILKRIKIA